MKPVEKKSDLKLYLIYEFSLIEHRLILWIVCLNEHINLFIYLTTINCSRLKKNLKLFSNEQIKIIKDKLRLKYIFACNLFEIRLKFKTVRIITI